MALLLGGLGVRAQLHAPVAHAAQTWEVAVGGDPTPGVTSINFYPRVLTINAGDAVNFTFPAAEPHTVTFDAGQVPGLFLTGITPNSPGPGDFDITKAFSPLNVSGPVSYDGTQVISSGIPLDPPGEREPFAVTFPKSGVYYYECAVHGPLMSGNVTVLASGSTAPESPVQASARGATEAKNDVTNTQAGGQAFPITEQETSGPGGATIHTLSAGAAGFHLADLHFFPGSDTVKRGDYITWSQPDPNEFHTITFMSGATPPAFVQVQPQPGGPPKIVLPAFTMVPSGGDTYTGTGVVTSGTLTAGNSWTVKIDAPPGTYDYICLFHADDYNMKGTITVTQ
jgi:plastocyanin